MPLERVVLDVNVIVSAAISKSLRQLLASVVRLNIQLFSCEELINELVIALTYTHVNKYLNEGDVKDIITLFLIASTEIEIDLRYDGLEDTKDNYLIDLAYACKADYLVSGDRKVLMQKHVGRIQIISPAQFNKLLQS